MIILKKIRAFLNLNMSKKRLLLEAFIYLGWARYLKFKPFAKIAPSLGTQMGETPLTINLENKEILQNVSDALHIMSRYTFWESECLVKALAGMTMLEKRKIESTLYLGTSKDENGEFIAHAWLRSGTFYVSGFEGMEKFTVIAQFAKGVKTNNHEGEKYG